jgi:hypothetical protein
MDELALLKTRATDKAEACEAIEEALLRIEADERQPDDWELECLTTGIGALFRGSYRLARVMAEKTLTPVYERARIDQAPEFDRFDLTSLWRAFTFAQGEPLKRSAHLGPIIFPEDLKPAA